MFDPSIHAKRRDHLARAVDRPILLMGMVSVRETCPWRPFHPSRLNIFVLHGMHTSRCFALDGGR